MIAGVGGEVPLHARHAEIAGQNLLDVRIADATRPLEEPAVAGHRDQTRERLQVVAVELGIRGRKLPEPCRHGRLRHGVHHEVDHAIEPRRAAQVLGDADQAVLGVLAGAEEAGRTEHAGRERQVAGDRRLRRREADFVAQHLHHPALVEVGIGELRGQDEIRIEIGAGVVRRVQPRASVRVESIGEQQRSRIGMSQATRCNSRLVAATVCSNCTPLARARSIAAAGAAPMTVDLLDGVPVGAKQQNRRTTRAGKPRVSTHAWKSNAVHPRYVAARARSPAA